MRRFKIPIATLILLTTFSMPGLAVEQVLIPIQVAAAAPQSQPDACNGLDQLGGTKCEKSGDTSSPGQNQIAGLAKDIINILSLITGIAAAIMIVVAGIRFITSGGESSAVSSAKNTLVYAIIGLIIVVLAQAIVHFVLNAVINNTVTQVKTGS